MGVTSPVDQGVSEKPLIFVAGPTAIGKTELALTLAEKFGCEIIGVDSMQIYRYMDIGTAKPSVAERRGVPHHLIDYVLPDEEYSASRFTEDCRQAIRQIRAKGRLPLLVGGTGLYFNALENGIFSMPAIDPAVRQGLRDELSSKGRGLLFQELTVCDPVSADRIHPNDTYRLLRALEIVRTTGTTWSAYIAEHQRLRSAPAKGGLNGLLDARPDLDSIHARQRQQGKKQTTNILKIGLDRDRDKLYQRINYRVEVMVQANLLAEVENLLEMGYAKDLQPMQSLGYRHMLNYLDGLWSWEKAVELLARDTRRYAKRQITWFKGDPGIKWFQPDQFAEIHSAIESFLERANTSQ